MRRETTDGVEGWVTRSRNFFGRWSGERGQSVMVRRREGVDSSGVVGERGAITFERRYVDSVLERRGESRIKSNIFPLESRPSSALPFFGHYVISCITVFGGYNESIVDDYVKANLSRSR